jgi:hypothetical protein
MSRVPRRRDHEWLYVPRAPAQPMKSVPAVPRSPPKAQSGEVPTRAYCIDRGNTHQSREAVSRAGMADPEEYARNYKLSGPANLLQTVYFWCRQKCKTSDLTYGGETSLPVGSRSEGRLPNTKRRPSVLPLLSLNGNQKGGSSLTQTKVTFLLEECFPRYWRVIAYYNKAPNKVERNYCVTQREILATVRILQHFRKYLYTREFHLRTSHTALTWLTCFKSLE